MQGEERAGNPYVRCMRYVTLSKEKAQKTFVFWALASPARFELTTFRLGGGRSILLSYGDMLICLLSNSIINYMCQSSACQSHVGCAAANYRAQSLASKVLFKLYPRSLSSSSSCRLFISSPKSSAEEASAFAVS